MEKRSTSRLEDKQANPIYVNDISAKLPKLGGGMEVDNPSEIEKFMPETAEQLPSTKYTPQYMAFFGWLWDIKNYRWMKKYSCFAGHIKTVRKPTAKHTTVCEQVV